MDLKVPALPKLPRIAISRRQVLIAVGATVAVIVVAFIGWTLYLNYNQEQLVATFGSHVAASEADLSRISAAVATYVRSSPDHRSISEADAYTQEFAALAAYGQAVTAYHRRIISTDIVPGSYAGAQSAYIRALDSLNRAFSLWYSAAGAYDAGAYTAAKDALAKADEAWKEYIPAAEDYDRELRTAEDGGGAPPA
jgi:hypothetical protein